MKPTENRIRAVRYLLKWIGGLKKDLAADRARFVARQQDANKPHNPHLSRTPAKE